MSYWNFPRSPASVGLLLEFGRTRNIAAASLLQGTGLRLAQLSDPDMTVSAMQELAVASNLLRQTRNEAGIGLRVGLSYQLSAYGILGYGLMSSATGADALRLAWRFLPLTYAFTSIAHQRRGALNVLAFEPPDELAPPLRQFVLERAMGATSRLLRDVLGNNFELSAFTMQRAASPARRQGRAPSRVLGAMVSYGAKGNALSFAHDHLTRPLPHANAVSAAMCERMCADLLARRRTRLDTAAFVREHLATQPAGRTPELAEFAAMFNTSERTLKRRLKQEGTSFRQLLNAVRQAKAERLIAAGRMTMTEIAAELGYSDLSSFSQAFKRWNGKAPSLSTFARPSRASGRRHEPPDV